MKKEGKIYSLCGQWPLSDGCGEKVKKGYGRCEGKGIYVCITFMFAIQYNTRYCIVFSMLVVNAFSYAHFGKYAHCF